MKHIRYLEDWPTVDGEPATERELMDRWDLRLLGEHSSGGWLMDCLGRGMHEGQMSDDLPGVRLRSGVGERRYWKLPDDCRGVCYHQRVIRGRKGHDVRGAASVHAERETGAPRRSPKGQGERPELEHAEKDDGALIKGAEEEIEKGRATKTRVCACEVEDTDVVETGPRPGHRWAGEPSRSVAGGPERDLVG